MIGNGTSYDASISGDGRYVAFYSGASNLVAGDANGHGDVFVHDRLTGRTELVSVSGAAEQGNGESYDPVIGADGRCVGFHSGASDLVDGDTNGYIDVFVHDRASGQTVRVSVSTTGAQGDGDSYVSSISDDCRHVGFHSVANNLVPGQVGNLYDALVHDRAFDQTELISISSDGTPGNSSSSHPSLTADGSKAVFSSSASNLVAGDTNFRVDVFVRERAATPTPGVPPIAGFTWTRSSHSEASRWSSGTPRPGSLGSTPGTSTTMKRRIPGRRIRCTTFPKRASSQCRSRCATRRDAARRAPW